MESRYASTFDDALQKATTAKPEERQAKMSALARSQKGREAHPTLEHLLPIHIAAGAAGSDVGERLWTFPERSLSWAQYRFGDVVVAAE
jgi:4,5-DOPA dioxygenase extradiol